MVNYRDFFLMGMGGDSRGEAGDTPQYFWGGDGYESVPPNNLPPVMYILWVIGFYTHDYCITGIHKEQHTFSKISQEYTRDTEYNFCIPIVIPGW